MEGGREGRRDGGRDATQICPVCALLFPSWLNPPHSFRLRSRQFHLGGGGGISSNTAEIMEAAGLEVPHILAGSRQKN